MFVPLTNYKIMKKITLVTAIMIASVVSTIAQSTNWVIDNVHSKIQFNIDHMVISEVSGYFHTYEGTIVSSKDDFSDASIEFSIDVNSIDTDNENRDGDLKSDNFFDAAKYPKITFKSSSMKKIADGKYKLTGDITMHGVTKQVILDVTYGGTVNDPWGNTKAGFKLTGDLNRKDFGLTYGATLEAGGLVVGEEVRLVCRIELIKQK